MEIQVRTRLQDAWAQISEKLGDIWGRGLRYGEGPDMPDHPAWPGATATRGEVVRELQLMSEAIHESERNQVQLEELREIMLWAGSCRARRHAREARCYCANERQTR